MKDPFLIIGFMLLALMISFEANALSKEEIKEQLNDIPFDFEQIKRDSINFNEIFKERDRKFQFVEIDRYPTEKERRMYYILNAIDVGMTIWALNNRDNIKEGNIFLNDNPSNQNLIANKLLTIPIYQNMSQPQVVVMNHIVGTVIVHNLYVINRYD